MKLLENVPLAPLTTFKVGGPARYFIPAESEEDVQQAVAFVGERSLPMFVLGGGSNLLVADAGFPGLVLRIMLKGITQQRQHGRELFDVGAGEDWDPFVAYVVERDCGGIECLSGIPGTVGGTPVQNVGAYGQEVAETITRIRVFDRRNNTFRDLSNRDAGFAYRSSVLNSSQQGRYIVLRVSYALTPGAPPRIEYADLKKLFGGGSKAPSLREARDAVRQIRRGKGMLLEENDPDCRSAGSFFKNPVVSQEQLEELRKQPAARGGAPPSFPAASGQVKLAAAWLVERAGFARGSQRGGVGISSKHSLAIVNRGTATAADIIALKNEIQARVLAEFGVALQPEPVFVGFELESKS